ncbi:MAG: YtpR family tRNA-binding protein [Patescibacteria group bacterium]
MRIFLNWLKDFVKIFESKHIKKDNVINQSAKFNQIIIGKILEIKQHPNADRLRLVKVDVGKAILDIVCGAPNLEVNQLVPVALVGAILPNDIEIKEAEIRGIKSFGMLCAEDELGLGKDHNGIMILSNNAKIGQKLVDYLDLNKIVRK